MHIYKKKIPKVQHKLHNYMTNIQNLETLISWQTFPSTTQLSILS